MNKGELPADFIATALPKGVVDVLKQGKGRGCLRPPEAIRGLTYPLMEA
ncbi:hypothetical protein H6G97_16105 [Nostoc flagelliforme FACHB-838]|uniref:Transposase n=1 Tax=Nostoc flagelliforme FACHB-838 TaxID=2692904 RepID=A0ABR8DNJ6_9NOSO|nr:hypothetical protein [Nostoc flagelliforme]MBD2531022.1 hypothetical protein [Nostoc flagelliforme FACHB-838]